MKQYVWFVIHVFVSFLKRKRIIFIFNTFQNNYPILCYLNIIILMHMLFLLSICRFPFFISSNLLTCMHIYAYARICVGQYYQSMHSCKFNNVLSLFSEWFCVAGWISAYWCRRSYCSFVPNVIKAVEVARRRGILVIWVHSHLKTASNDQHLYQDPFLTNSN